MLTTATPLDSIHTAPTQQTGIHGRGQGQPGHDRGDSVRSAPVAFRACTGLVWGMLMTSGILFPRAACQTPPIEILRTVPTYTPPGVPLCPIANHEHVDDAFYEPRVSGVWGFTDFGPSAAPFAVPREYALGGRGDGLILVDATPPTATNARVTAAALSGNYAGFLPDLRQFAPHNLMAPYPVPPFYSPTTGWPASAASANNCGTGLSGMVYSPWRECTVLYDATNDHYYAYLADGGRANAQPDLPGMWVVRLIRAANGELQLPPANGGVQAVTATADFNRAHNIVADQASGLIVIVENPWGQSTERVHIYSVTSPGTHLAPVKLHTLYDIQGLHAHPHDAHFKDGKLWISNWGMPLASPPVDGWVDEYSVSALRGVPAPVPLRSLRLGSSSSGILSAHSLAVDGSTLWVAQEDQGWPAGWHAGAVPGRLNFQSLDLTRQVVFAPGSTSVSPAPGNGSYYPVPAFYPILLAPGVTPAVALSSALNASHAAFGSIVGEITMAMPPLPV